MYLGDGIRGLQSFLLLLRLCILLDHIQDHLRRINDSPTRFVAADAGFLPSVPLTLFADILDMYYLLVEDSVNLGVLFQCVALLEANSPQKLLM